MNKTRAAFAVLMLLGGCATVRSQWQDDVHTRAAFDLNCPKEQVTVTLLSKGSPVSGPVYGAQGCNRRATYIADTRNGVRMNSPITQDGLAGGKDPPQPR